MRKEVLAVVLETLLPLGSAHEHEFFRWNTPGANLAPDNVHRRQAPPPGYHPEFGSCGSGTTCEDACGPNWISCQASTDLSLFCYNKAELNQTCCENGSGRACESGYYCAWQEFGGRVWCWSKFGRMRGVDHRHHYHLHHHGDELLNHGDQFPNYHNDIPNHRNDVPYHGDQLSDDVELVQQHTHIFDLPHEHIKLSRPNGYLLGNDHRNLHLHFCRAYRDGHSHERALYRLHVLVAGRAAQQHHFVRHHHRAAAAIFNFPQATDPQYHDHKDAGHGWGWKSDIKSTRQRPASTSVALALISANGFGRCSLKGNN